MFSKAAAQLIKRHAWTMAIYLQSPHRGTCNTMYSLANSARAELTLLSASNVRV